LIELSNLLEAFFCKNKRFFLGALFFGVTARIFNLLLFFGSIRLVAFAFNSNVDHFNVNTVQKKITPAAHLEPELLATIIVLSFLLASFFELYSVKLKKLLMFRVWRGLRIKINTDFKNKQKVSRDRATNSLRQASDAIFTSIVLFLVCLLAMLCLTSINFRLGACLFIGSITILYALIYIQNFVGIKRLKFIFSYFSFKPPLSLPSSKNKTSLLVSEKFKFIDYQLYGVMLTNTLISITLAVVILNVQNNFFIGAEIFDIVIFIYTLRFIATQGRGSATNFYKYKFHLDLSKNHLELK